jgi:hypothetical protein
VSDTVIVALIGLVGVILTSSTLGVIARKLWRRMTAALHAAETAATESRASANQTTSSDANQAVILKRLEGIDRSVKALWEVTGIQEQLIEKSLPHREVLRQTYPHRQENNLL